ncbi:MAG: sulfotransferase [Alphaproteobacteria bacterium]|jgi:hypothetical protein|nr:sulfotransferase [Alphaproteobacteria bacterium]MDP6517952.1 sulfotransferase [Alphaproteobacteria bacterium]
MTLPDFIIIGAQKSGTTWLAWCLRQHPQLFLASDEIHFFDIDRHFSMGPDWYRKHFTDAKEGQVVGEKTPDYLWNNEKLEIEPKDIAARIHKTLPNAKLIIILRDPVTRAISALNHQIRGGRISPFVPTRKIFLDSAKERWSEFGIMSRGYYRRQIENYYNYFDKSNIKIFFYEDDMIKNPASTLSESCDFLSVSSHRMPKVKKRRPNSGMNSKLGLIINYYVPSSYYLIRPLDLLLPKKTPLQSDRRLMEDMYAHFQDENERLFDLVGRRTDAWRPATGDH